MEKIEGDKLVDLLQIAWGIIANANGGDWDKATPEWKGAAERWRDKYHDGVLAHIEEDDMPVFPGIDPI